MCASCRSCICEHLLSSVVTVLQSSSRTSAESFCCPSTRQSAGMYCLRQTSCLTICCDSDPSRTLSSISNPTGILVGHALAMRSLLSLSHFVEMCSLGNRTQRRSAERRLATASCAQDSSARPDRMQVPAHQASSYVSRKSTRNSAASAAAFTCKTALRKQVFPRFLMPPGCKACAVSGERFAIRRRYRVV